MLSLLPALAAALAPAALGMNLDDIGLNRPDQGLLDRVEYAELTCAYNRLNSRGDLARKDAPPNTPVMDPALSFGDSVPLDLLSPLIFADLNGRYAAPSDGAPRPLVLQFQIIRVTAPNDAEKARQVAEIVENNMAWLETRANLYSRVPIDFALILSMHEDVPVEALRRTSLARPSPVRIIVDHPLPIKPGGGPERILHDTDYRGFVPYPVYAHADGCGVATFVIDGRRKVRGVSRAGVDEHNLDSAIRAALREERP